MNHRSKKIKNNRLYKAGYTDAEHEALHKISNLKQQCEEERKNCKILLENNKNQQKAIKEALDVNLELQRVNLEQQRVNEELQRVNLEQKEVIVKQQEVIGNRQEVIGKQEIIIKDLEEANKEQKTEIDGAVIRIDGIEEELDELKEEILNNENKKETMCNTMKDIMDENNTLEAKIEEVKNFDYSTLPDWANDRIKRDLSVAGAKKEIESKRKLNRNQKKFSDMQKQMVGINSKIEADYAKLGRLMANRL